MTDLKQILEDLKNLVEGKTEREIEETVGSMHPYDYADLQALLFYSTKLKCVNDSLLAKDK